MKRKLIVLFSGIFLVLVLTTAASADSGPKPSVRVTFENMGEEVCYGTLLSLTDSTGPSSAWDGTEHNRPNLDEEEKRIWRAFVDYEDVDGYYFLQEWWPCSETKTLDWTYYPPRSFKVLLYYPEEERFAVSGVQERYAFDSYFTVDLARNDAVSIKELHVEKSYDYAEELISLAARIVLTIALELAVALLFFRRWAQLLRLIALVNIVTQVGLNVALNIINYQSGLYAFFFWYFVLELLVFAVEAVVYCSFASRAAARRIGKGRCIAYALTANVFSFIVGLLLAKLLPGIF